MKKNDDLKVGDRVTITDGSYSVRVDEFEPFTRLGLCRDVFEIISVEYLDHLTTIHTHTNVHNIYIKNTVNGKVYLHSKAFVEKVLTEAESIRKQIEELKARLVQIEGEI